MYYKKMTNEELNQCKYPNLIAEIIESGYSTITLADFMGLGPKKNGRYRRENDPEVWDKINGKEEMLASHAAGLCKYYNADFDYLFSNKLHVVSGKPVAYWKWYEENRKKEAEFKRAEEIRTIEYELHSRPELLVFMKTAVTLNADQIQLATNMLVGLAESDVSICEAIGA